MKQPNSMESQKQDTIAGDQPILTEGTPRVPDVAQYAEPCAETDDSKPSASAALTGDSGGGTSGNHGNGTAG